MGRFYLGLNRCAHLAPCAVRRQSSRSVQTPSNAGQLTKKGCFVSEDKGLDSLHRPWPGFDSSLPTSSTQAHMPWFSITLRPIRRYAVPLSTASRRSSYLRLKACVCSFAKNRSTAFFFLAFQELAVCFSHAPEDQSARIPCRRFRPCSPRAALRSLDR